jgi:hypothetical protein
VPQPGMDVAGRQPGMRASAPAQEPDQDADRGRAQPGAPAGRRRLWRCVCRNPGARPPACSSWPLQEALPEHACMQRWQTPWGCPEGRFTPGQQDGRDAAVKMFKGETSPDGQAADEIAVTCHVDHPNLSRCLSSSGHGCMRCLHASKLPMAAAARRHATLYMDGCKILSACLRTAQASRA